MRVRAHHGAHPGIEKASHRDFLRRRFRVHIHKNNRRLLAQLVHSLGGSEEGVIDRLHERLPLQVQHSHQRETFLSRDAKPLSRRALGIVVRAHKTRLALQQRLHLALIPQMIAGRHHIHSCFKHLARGCRRDARAAGHVLPVGDDEVDLERLAEARQKIPHRLAPRFPDDVANEKQLHGPHVTTPNHPRKAQANQ